MWKVSADNVKPTICTLESIARKVTADYRSRGFEQVKMALIPGDSYHWDFGGSLLGTMVPVQVGVLSFFPHQLYGVERNLSDLEDRGGYVKLHGKYTCFCLPADEALRLRELISAASAGIQAQADAQFSTWLDARAANPVQPGLPGLR